MEFQSPSIMDREAEATTHQVHNHQEAGEQGEGAAQGRGQGQTDRKGEEKINVPLPVTNLLVV